VLLAEMKSAKSPELIPAALGLVNDPDARVRLQLACSVGEWNTPEAGAALARLALNGSGIDDPLWATAIISSATHHYAALAEAVINAKRPPTDTLYRDLLTMAVARNDRPTLAKLLSPIIAGEANAEHVTAFTQFVESLAPRKLSLAKYAEGKDELAQLIGRDASLFEAAQKIAGDSKAAVPDRAAAVTLLGFHGTNEADLAVLTALLSPQTPPDVQVAAVRAISRTAKEKTPGILTSHWAMYSPTTRGPVMDVLLSNEAWAIDFLSQIEQGKIPVRQFDPIRRARVAKMTSPRIKELASKVLGGGDAAARQKVVDQHMVALTLTGDPTRGLKVFTQNCGTCHHVNDVGNEIGPDLRSVAGWQADALLTAILDPNRQVEAEYLSYNAVTNGGDQLFGIITAETDASITIKGLDAKEQTLPRTVLKSLEATNKSLMPDGLESAVSDQDLADVIRFLQTLK
jgi:putative heme-binding domain-containing protein